MHTCPTELRSTRSSLELFPMSPPPPPPPPAAPPPPPASVSSKAKACAVRALEAQLVVANMDFLFLPLLGAFLPVGAAREAIMFVLGTVGGFWVPSLFVMYNVAKLRETVREAAAGARDRCACFL